MKAKESSFIDFLRGPKQLIIPIYQRTYSWSRKHCKQLWDDILRVAENEDIPAHFIGSVVYITEGIYQATSIPRMLVIDGQQRLTTLSLLLSALARAIETNDSRAGLSSKRINNYYLFNNDEDEELRYKLILTRSDKTTLINLLEGMELPQQASHRILDNYQYFENQISTSGIDSDTLYHGISKLVVVDVSLDRTHDNPQLIFESLNSTGLDLSQADLIRNFILMGLEPQEQENLYTRYWFPMEHGFGHAEYVSLFDRFMRDYLTIKSDTGKIPNIRDVYTDFKSYVRRNVTESVQELVADIYLYSKYFVKLAFPQRNNDAEIRRILEGINTLKVDVAYPLLMEVYDDYERHQLISREEFIEILLLVESYVLRRAICGIPTNSMNKTFATFKRAIEKSDYLASIQYAFLTLEGYRRFPQDDEFWSEFVSKDIYNLRNRRNYVLDKLENHDRREFVNVETYTIEHIMPQNPNLPKEWRDGLGTEWNDTQSKYLHTIGNLTLTGYNPELSDRPFREKRDMPGGFADSPLRLNRGLANLENWGAQEISDRAAELADVALDIWPFPQMLPEVFEEYQRKLTEEEKSDYTIDSLEYLEGEMQELFEALRIRILNLDSSVREEIKKLYIAYKTTTNFVDIVPQRSRLRLSLNMAFDEIDDPRAICVDVTEKGRWGNGDVEVGISSFDEIDYILFLIRQSFAMHTDGLED